MVGIREHASRIESTRLGWIRDRRFVFVRWKFTWQLEIGGAMLIPRDSRSEDLILEK